MKSKLLAVMVALSLMGCATIPDYVICDTPDCGDPVDIIIED